MTDAEARALGERLKACPGFRWMLGMTARWKCGRTGALNYAVSFGEGGGFSIPVALRDEAPWPDIRDAATRGCVLELVRRALGDYDTHPICEDEASWGVWRAGPGVCLGYGSTEIEALVIALEAAP